MVVDVGEGSNFVLYLVSDADFIAMSSDALSVSHPLLSGEFRAQTLTSFGDSSLNAPAVFTSVAFDPTSNGPVASIGQVTPNGTGSANLVLDINDAGTFVALQSTAMTYSVSPNGRTATTGFTHSPVFYLVNANQGFFVGTDPIASAGQFEPQTGGPFNNGSLNGTYCYGTDGAAIGSRLTAVGAVNFDGDKNDQATEDDSSPAGLAPNLPLSNTQYSFSSTSSTPGRGTLDAQGKNGGLHHLADKTGLYQHAGDQAESSNSREINW